MSDERFDEWVQRAAKSYNRPPDIPPRDAMWDSIQSRVRSPESREFGSRRAMISRQPWVVAAAAILLVAVGIGIGRVSVLRRGARGEAVVQVPSSRAQQNDTSPPSAVTSVPGGLPGRESTLASRDPRETRAAGIADAQLTSYDVVTAQHLTSVEALLTSFKTTQDTSMDAGMRRWSRELLSNTRLLLASPAGSNPDRRHLLEDLELVLVQMSQLPLRDATLDRELIERAIARRQVLTRIRSSIPAGASGGT